MLDESIMIDNCNPYLLTKKDTIFFDYNNIQNDEPVSKIVSRTQNFETGYYNLKDIRTILKGLLQ